ncbi:MAG: HlyD family secretion protein [Acidobacteriota bacterium]|jgi:HlyD family secretion protein|nr:HlyD family secretion protein [Acidobacteriota bacterium]
MDREITADIRRRRLIRRVATVIVAIAAIAFSFAATVQWLRPSVKRRNIQTARVERGAVDASLQASGTVVPATEQVVSSPVEARVLRIVRRAGDRVRAGDEVIALDTSATRLDAERLADRVAQKESEEAQLRLRVEETIATLRAQIEQKKLDREIVAFKAEQNAKLSREGLITTQENLAAATAVKKTDIELTQLHDALTRAQRNAEAQLAGSAMELRTLRKEMAESNRQVGLAMMRADRDGVVTWAVQDAGATIRRGDVVARIADLSSFRVVATISDVHVAKLSAGMPARVRLDDSTLVDGTIAGIDPRIENGTARFYVDLAQPSHAKLRNNLRVDVFVVTGRRNGALRVRRGALGQGEREEVFVVRGDELVRVPAQWGLAGEETIEVTGGLREGDEVVISNMNDYAGVKKLRLE